MWMRVFVSALVLLALSMPVHAQSQPIRSPTNEYFTPKQTFTPATTFETPQGGKQTQISGVGPSISSDPYTWSYTAAQSTLLPTDNPSLSSSLAKEGHGPGASDLNPAPDHLQNGATVKVNSPKPQNNALPTLPVSGTYVILVQALLASSLLVFGLVVVL
ncbi:hypothetical protein MVES_002855 [Malassezia vespertilionis]|uniref:Uncharacterized protein n=1 Tax=Malassezia vespertilionis TaxID=2020962 RepID=A0A2N1J9I2_9BASI|nr:hypothetical protein MVES_002855 [Malassezia vespertilionis]